MDEMGPAQLRQRLGEVSLVEAARIGRRIDSLRRLKEPGKRSAEIAKIAQRIDRSAAATAARAASVPAIRYPEELPVSQLRTEIAEAIAAHQVVIVAGETGSGKTTQLPKICLELGLGIRGSIGHTQPRRLAARTVAERISEELGTPLGQAVGYKVRFTDKVNDATLVKLMTDGILLAEIQTDPQLRAYDVIIIDEAHERSLNIDFILGYLKQLLPRRPDLKLIITSATIETERFSGHFGNAPVISVSGRTYPVEVRYRPIGGSDEARGGDDQDEVGAICEAVAELQSHGDGDILVFLSGEREIRDTADALKGRVLAGTEVLPLYARLTAAEQHRVFERHTNRRVVLATNVAETSLTVPGIHYVVDPGNARISRYSNRLKVQRLPIEPISQAGANQRAGRCGRVAAGVCIRLYSEQDFHTRPEYTEPEILRTNLASVILRMMALGLGDIEAFPFVEPPDHRHIRDGLELLRELGAVAVNDGDPSLTDVGKRMAQLPVDPRLSRMLLEAERNGCLREVLIIISALSIQDPRERPADKQQQADAAHKRFAAQDSDFMALINLWNYLREQQKARSSSSFRRMCRTEYLHYLRVREWQDLHGQLRSIATGLGLQLNDNPAPPNNVHISLLAGLLSHIGMKTADKQDYLGARGARFAIFPGSSLFKANPQWVMAAELVDTSRLWARTVARIQPEWAESLAGDLAKHNYSEPHWETKRASTVAFERVTLYGIPIVARRKIDYSRIDPETSRDLFIQHALVGRDWHTHHQFLKHNRELLRQADERQQRARRTGLVADDDALFAFYDARLPAKVVNGRTFDVWWKSKRREDPQALTFSLDMLITDDTEFHGSYSVGPSTNDSSLKSADIEKLRQLSRTDHQFDGDSYPDFWHTPTRDFALKYSFNPGSDEDGVTVVVPIEAVPQVDAGMFEWQVPGNREQVITELIRSLPKAVRTQFIPAPDWARKINRVVTPEDGPLLAVLSDQLRKLTGVRVAVTDWDVSKLPNHLRMRYEITDDKGVVLTAGRDLSAAKAAVARQVEGLVSAAASGVERTGIVAWDFGDLPTEIEANGVVAYPALVDARTSVSIEAVARPETQRELMRTGTRRLLSLELPPPSKAVIGALTNRAKLALARGPYPSIAALLDDCASAAIDELMRESGGPVYTEQGYVALREAIRPRLPSAFRVIVTDVENILFEAGEADALLNRLTADGYAPGVAAVRGELSELIYPGFVTTTGSRRLPDLALYARAAKERAQRLADDPNRDARIQADFLKIKAESENELASMPPAVRSSPKAQEIRWMLADLQVSLFAPTIKLKRSISPQRIQKAIKAICSEG